MKKNTDEKKNQKHNPTVFMFFYRLFYISAKPMAKALSKLPIKNESFLKLSNTIKLRSNFSKLRKNNICSKKNSIWFHCASGELEYAIPIIRLIKKNNPASTILLTYFSPSIHKQAQLLEFVDIAIASPWDQVSHMTSFINTYAPKALIVARTDIWPEMIYQTNKYNIPSFLISAFIPNSLSFTQKKILPLFSQIFTVNKLSHENLLNNNLKNHQIIGDTRFDQTLNLQQNPSLSVKLVPLLGKSEKPIFVLGSTWPEDEEIMLQIIKQTVNEFLFVIAPHEPTAQHLKNIEKKIKALNISSIRFSEVNEKIDINLPNSPKLIILDQIGILKYTYSFASLVFIGGSFKNKVHSVMEPLSAGCLCLVGPYINNSPEALEFSRTILSNKLNAVTSCKDLESMSKYINKLITQKAFAHTITLKNELIRLLLKKSGASESFYRYLKKEKIV